MRAALQSLAAALVVLLLHGAADARMARINQIPNGAVNNCLACHTSPTGGSRNAFGQQIEASYLVPPGKFGVVQWGSELAGLDPDGDGVSNGTELNDPTGSWVPGDSAPGDPGSVTNPGVADTSPPPAVPGLSWLGYLVLLLFLIAASFWYFRTRQALVRAGKNR